MHNVFSIPTCSQCAAGKYKISPGNRVCTKCDAGQNSSAVGATSNVCQPCPANSFPDASLSSCVCNAGFLRNEATLCVPYEINNVIKLSDSYHTILQSSGTSAAGLLRAAALAHPRVNNIIVYDSSTREENMWQYLTGQTTRSCQDLVPVLAEIEDVQDQYVHLVRLLIHDGPCAPGFEGYDLLQDPGNLDVSDSECVLTATTSQDTGRDALMVVQRRFVERNRTNQYEIYNYSAQYFTPALVRHVFGDSSRAHMHVSFCNVRNLQHAPVAMETTLSRVALWTQPQNFSIQTPHILSEHIVQSGQCPS